MEKYSADNITEIKGAWKKKERQGKILCYK